MPGKEQTLHIKGSRKMSGEEAVVAPAEALAHLGLHEGAKVIEKPAAHLFVLDEECDQLDYVKLIKGLCADYNVKLITVAKAKTLGEWAGLIPGPMSWLKGKLEVHEKERLGLKNRIEKKAAYLQELEGQDET
ncbi:hypothetical protein L6164_012201 [Bauhinia variegata]|uniref:Uncharacterized protein n=1 Tax=Bauhinia variegata TaxID=167791 RepID=A0ACB9P9B6_BAUVA|nr:hypothetical protein L6164_012201 [Bauhinia variegata]